MMASTRQSSVSHLLISDSADLLPHARGGRGSQLEIGTAEPNLWSWLVEKEVKESVAGIPSGHRRRCCPPHPLLTSAS